MCLFVSSKISIPFRSSLLNFIIKRWFASPPFPSVDGGGGHSHDSRQCLRRKWSDRQNTINPRPNSTLALKSQKIASISSHSLKGGEQNCHCSFGLSQCFFLSFKQILPSLVDWPCLQSIRLLLKGSRCHQHWGTNSVTRPPNRTHLSPLLITRRTEGEGGF